MAFVYFVGLPSSVAFLTSSGTTNTELANMVLRQATRNVELQSILVCGKANALTAISGIAFRVRRWTTAGSGGTAITPAPRRIGTTASTTAASSSGGAITPGSVDGSTQVAFGCGVSSPGGWMARDEDSKIMMEAGSADELCTYSIAVAVSLNFELGEEIAE